MQPHMFLVVVRAETFDSLGYLLGCASIWQSENNLFYQELQHILIFVRDLFSILVLIFILALAAIMKFKVIR